MKKFNLLLNSSFKKFNFNDKIEESSYSRSDANMINYSVNIVLQSKPDSNDTFESMDVGDELQVYVFPMSTSNYSFNAGDLLYMHDNNALFIIVNHITDSQFIIKLIDVTDGSGSYDLANNSLAILHNANFEKFIYDSNTLKEIISSQRTEYTEYINGNNNFVKFLLEKMVISDTDSTVGISFNFALDTENALFSNIVNKFFMNVLVYNYNDFKYIYSSDIKSGESLNNAELASTKLIAGVLKSLQTKILPHFSSKLILGNSYEFTSDLVNKYTKYSKNYDNDKLLIVVQLSLADKSTVYDQTNNVESDYMYIIK